MRIIFAIVLGLTFGACSGGGAADGTGEPPNLQVSKPTDKPFTAEAIASFEEPWAMTFLPRQDGRLLVTEKSGQLYLVTREGQKTPVAGVPDVDYGGQGGLGDVILHPHYAENGLIYLSYVEAGDKGKRRGAAVARAQLDLAQTTLALSNVEVIWRQVPKVTGRGHYGHRLAFDTDGYLFVSSGERQKFDPSQDMQSNLGKIVRLHDDGGIPTDNPFFAKGGVTAQIWSSGHRNPLGLAFDGQGRLWNHEMGPRGGDELNLVERGANHGYPAVSNGDHYSRKAIADHPTRPEFTPPKAWWTPVISPAGLIFYSGDKFPDWQGSALIGGLGARALVRVQTDGDSASEIARYPMGKRIREVEQAPDGGLWLLEDGSGGQLLRLDPK